VPSGVVWPGLSAKLTTEIHPAWTHDGKGLAFMPSPPFDPEVWGKLPVVLTPTFHKAMSMRAARGMARNRSRKDQRADPDVLGLRRSDVALARARRYRGAAAAQAQLRASLRAHHLCGAGHLFRFPYSPVISEIFHPVVRVTMALGGDAVANAAAERDSWERLLSFLASSL